MLDKVLHCKEQTFLLVDDSVADRVLFRELINRSQYFSDYTIVEASSCEEALLLLQDFIPTCCLVDYQLPVDNGLDFLKAIRRLEYEDNIPVIIMTGEGDERIAVEMMRNGAQDYLIKNDITVTSLTRSINQAIHTCELQTKLRHLAHYDHLTGLLNRSLFLDRLRAAMSQAQRYEQQCSLLYIDVDNFKQINDQYGHESGDILLKAVGNRIKKNCRVTDGAARLGGDEFAILLNHVDQVDAQSIAEKMLEEIAKPIELSSQSIQVSLSIGVAHYPDTASDIQELMRQADEAMYRAKRTGKARYFQFTQEQKEQWQRKSTLEALLPVAIQNGELSLAYQPIVKAEDKSLHCLEALVRWHPEGYTVSALEIIELVSRLGLFDIFHLWMIDAALKQLHQWSSDNKNVGLCLNTPVDYCHGGLIMEYLQQTMAKYYIEPNLIELEVAENALMKSPEFSDKLIKEMKKQGFRIAVDKFGSGYSSMMHLARLHLNTLKIDRELFFNAENDERKQKVIKAITMLGHSLGLSVVAEGVETVEQYNLACKMGCDYIQGFLFGEPLLGDDNWLVFIKQFPGAQFTNTL